MRELSAERTTFGDGHAAAIFLGRRFLWWLIERRWDDLQKPAAKLLVFLPSGFLFRRVVQFSHTDQRSTTMGPSGVVWGKGSTGGSMR